MKVELVKRSEVGDLVGPTGLTGPPGPAGTAQYDKGELFAGRLLSGAGDVVAGLAGDSTGNWTDEWAYLTLQALGVLYPERTVQSVLWNDTTQAYAAPVTIQTGAPPPIGVTFYDSFSRTASELYLTLPDIGLAWGRDGSNAAGDWTIDGTNAVATASSPAGTMYADGGVAGDLKVTVPIVMNTTNSGALKQWRLYLTKVNNNTHVYVDIQVSATGVRSSNLVKTIAGVTNIIDTEESPVAAGAATAFTMSLQIIGTAVTATVGAATLTATLNAGDVTAMSGTTKAGIQKLPTAGDTISDITLEVLSSPPPPVLTFYNASMPGSTLAYQQPRLTAMFPVEPDLLFVSAGHNYGAGTVDAFTAALDSFIADYHALWPDSGLVITSQNPERAPFPTRAQHLQRQVSIRSFCSQRGIGYVPTIEAFLALGAAGWGALLLIDGVHPTAGPSGTGSSLWRDTVLAYLARFNS